MNDWEGHSHGGPPGLPLNGSAEPNFEAARTGSRRRCAILLPPDLCSHCCAHVEAPHTRLLCDHQSLKYPSRFRRSSSALIRQWACPRPILLQGCLRAWGQQTASSCWLHQGQPQLRAVASPKITPFLGCLAVGECLRQNRDAQPFQPGDIYSVGQHSRRAPCWAGEGLVGPHRSSTCPCGHCCLCPPPFTGVDPQRTSYVHTQVHLQNTQSAQVPSPSYYSLVGHD